MSYLKCPDCGKEIELFGKSRAEEMGKEFNISPVMRVPLNPAVAQAADEGRIAFVREDAVAPLADKLAAL